MELIVRKLAPARPLLCRRPGKAACKHATGAIGVDGRVLARAEDGETLVSADIDTDEIDAARFAMPTHRDADTGSGHVLARRAEGECTIIRVVVEERSRADRQRRAAAPCVFK